MRARSLDRVNASADSRTRRDAAWDALAARRDAEIEAGKSETVPGAEVVARLRAELICAPEISSHPGYK